MNVSRAVITSAGPGQRTLPLQRLIDRDGVAKTVLQIIVEEAIRAEIEAIGVVVAPGDAAAFAEAAGEHRNRLHFIEQTEPRVTLLRRERVGEDKEDRQVKKEEPARRREREAEGRALRAHRRPPCAAPTRGRAP